MADTHYLYIHLFTTRMYGCWKMHPYIWPVYGPYVWVSKCIWPYIRPCMGRMYGYIFQHPYVWALSYECKKMHPHIEAINTALMYGPYVRVVRIGLYCLCHCSYCLWHHFLYNTTQYKVFISPKVACESEALLGSGLCYVLQVAENSMAFKQDLMEASNAADWRSGSREFHTEGGTVFFMTYHLRAVQVQNMLLTNH